MKVVAKSTPPPKDSRPIMNLLEFLILAPSDFVNHPYLYEITMGMHPNIMEIPKRQTIVIIFACKTYSWSSALSIAALIIMSGLIWSYEVTGVRGYNVSSAVSSFNWSLILRPSCRRAHDNIINDKNDIVCLLIVGAIMFCFWICI